MFLFCRSFTKSIPRSFSVHYDPSNHASTSLPQQLAKCCVEFSYIHHMFSNIESPSNCYLLFSYFCFSYIKLLCRLVESASLECGIGIQQEFQSSRSASFLEEIQRFPGRHLCICCEAFLRRASTNNGSARRRPPKRQL